jgi:hypothetical protein
MTIDPAIQASVLALITQLGTKVAEGAASEAGKNTWMSIKSLFGWPSDPAPIEISAKVENGIATSPEILGKLQQLLDKSEDPAISGLVGKIDAKDSNVVVTHSLGTLNIH